MEFNQLVSDRLGPLFEKHNFCIVAQLKNYIQLKSDCLCIALGHDERENANVIYVGKSEGYSYSINEHMLKEVFNSNIKIDYVSQEDFVNNLAVFFEGAGNLLLSGDVDVLENIEKVVHEMTAAYNKKLNHEQTLNAANVAWEKEDYEGFIKHVDLIGRQNLPPSYGLKYKMANLKLK